ncbi:hypothetical protein AK812_SmicGene16121 [Symbiodinium microadriaticum]|uniref:Uncharacterized protein n=1 Tax=Symbiodinium microadriaticum TaxID=2951 RepID=A0A1Q9E142_SYMMI|nr:hypothetical protein AK812_SmicGene16121 [Symbiodinium microadriaticum]
MMSFTALSNRTAEALPSKDGVISLTNIADELGSMSLEDLVSNGGSYILLREGEALLIPPGFFFFQCGLGYMNAPKSFHQAFAAVPKSFVHDKDMLQTASDHYEVAHHHAESVKKVAAAISHFHTTAGGGTVSRDRAQADDADLEWEISRAKKHELFRQYVASVQATDKQAIESTEANAEEGAEAAVDKQQIDITVANAKEGAEAAVDKQQIDITVANAKEGDKQQIDITVANAKEGADAAVDKQQIDITVANAKEGASRASCRAFEAEVDELQKKMGNIQPGEEPFSPGVKVPDYAALPGAADLEKLAEVAVLQAELGEREIPAGSVLNEAEIAVAEMRQTLLSRKAAAAQDPSAEQDPVKQKAAAQSLSEQAKQNSVPVNNPTRPGSLQDYLRRAAASADNGSAKESKEKGKQESKAKAKVKADAGP